MFNVERDPYPLIVSTIKKTEQLTRQFEKVWVAVKMFEFQGME